MLKSQDHQYSQTKMGYVGLVTQMRLLLFVQTKDLMLVLIISVDITSQLKLTFRKKARIFIFLEVAKQILNQKFLKFSVLMFDYTFLVFELFNFLSICQKDFIFKIFAIYS